MAMNPPPGASATRPAWLRTLTRPDVMSGLMFITVAIVGLAVSWNYPIGTAIRMGTGYVPRLFCWILLALGVLVFVMGLRGESEESHEPPLDWRPLIMIPAALVVFALTIQDYGIVIAGLATIAVAGLAFRQSKPIEVAISAVVLVFFTWAIFIWALGLTLPVWPGG